MQVTADYVWLGKLENEIRQSDYALQEISYGEGVDIFVHVLAEQEQDFIDWMTDLTNGQATIACIDKLFVEFILK